MTWFRGEKERPQLNPVPEEDDSIELDQEEEDLTMMMRTSWTVIINLAWVGRLKMKEHKRNDKDRMTKTGRSRRQPLMEEQKTMQSKVA